MKTTAKFVFTLIVGAAACFAGVAYAEIRVGSVLSVTGGNSAIGEPEKQTLEVYVKKINDEGGLNGQKIRLILYDDVSDANLSRTFATRLIEEDKIHIMVGGSGTGNSLAMIQSFEDAQIPFVSISGGTEIINPVRKWVFKPPHTDAMACEKAFDDMRKRGLTKVAMIVGQGGFAKSGHAQCKKVSSKYKIDIISEESYGARDSDVTPQLMRIKAVPGVQAVFNFDSGQGPAIVTRNYAQLQIGLPLYQSHGSATQGYLNMSGAAANGVRITAPSLLVALDLPDSDPQKSVLLNYKKTIEQATNQPVGTFGGYAYDGLMLAVDAIKRAKSTDANKVRDELEKTKNFIGTVGVINMSPTDHLGIDLTSFRMLEIRNGKWTLAN